MRLVQEIRIFAFVLRPERMKIFTTGAAKRMVQTIQKNIRVTPEQWKRIESEAEKREISSNRLVVKLVVEALKHREWPRTEAEIHLLCSAMFTAQAIIRDMRRLDVRRKSSKSGGLSPKPHRNSRTGRRIIRNI